MATFHITEIFRMEEGRALITGRVETGKLELGMRTTIDGKTLQLSSIESKEHSLERANEGMNVGISLTLLTQKNNSILNIFKTKDVYEIVKKYKNKTIDFE